MPERISVSVVLSAGTIGCDPEQSLLSIEGQTCRAEEIFCVDDGSSPSFSACIAHHAEADGRIRILRCSVNEGRNLAIEQAKGKYLYFLAADTVCKPNLLRRACSLADGTQAEVAAFHTERFVKNGKPELVTGVETGWFPAKQPTFGYGDCIYRVLNVVRPVLACRVYRTAFLRERGLRFEPLLPADERAFCAVSIAVAEKVVPIGERLCTELTDVAASACAQTLIDALESCERRVGALPYARKLERAVLFFVSESLTETIWSRAMSGGLDSEDSRRLFAYAHRRFNSGRLAELKLSDIKDDTIYARYLAVRAQPYERFLTLLNSTVRVSFTSWPPRIGDCAQVARSLLRQTRQPEQVLLYLSREEFPGGKAELPADLVALTEDPKFAIRWCEGNLKVH